MDEAHEPIENNDSPMIGIPEGDTDQLSEYGYADVSTFINIGKGSKCWKEFHLTIHPLDRWMIYVDAFAFKSVGIISWRTNARG